MLRSMLLMLYLSASTHGFAAEPDTFACVEERSIGSEFENYGRFKPDSSPRILKIYPKAIDGEHIVSVPWIEIIEDGESASLTSSDCAETALEAMQPLSIKELYNRMCAGRLKSAENVHNFGTTEWRFWFSNISKATFSYVETAVVAADWAYMSMGSCTRISAE